MSRIKYSREAVKQGATEVALRERIVSGTWGPGHRLPTHDELLEQFAISKTTIQRAMDQLVSEGFLETKGSRGTFVSPRPPHLSDYGLVFHGTPNDPSSWGRFWQTLSSSADVIQNSTDRKFPRFHGIRGHVDTEDYQSLRRSLRSQRLAGLIFASDIYHLTGDPILEQPGIPRVAFMSAQPNLTLPTVEVQHSAFFDRAVDYLASRGRKRIGVLFHAGVHADRHDLEDSYLAALQRRGLAQSPYWCQYVNVFHPTAICRCVHLMMHAREPAPPDALIVSDDTMLDAVINGLFAAGVNVPRDLEVVAHANFPVTATAMPVERLGYDTRHVLRTCMNLIDKQRRNEPVPAATKLPPMFEDEISGSLPT